jgi:hypothetical protein
MASSHLDVGKHDGDALGQRARSPWSACSALDSE